MKKILQLLFTALIFCSSCSPKYENPTIAHLGFENLKAGDLEEITEGGIRIKAEPDNIRIYPKKGNSSPNSLHIVGGDLKSVEIINESDTPARYLGFVAERWTSVPPFRFKIETFQAGQWKEIYNGDKELKTGNFPNDVMISLPDSKNQRFKFTSTSPTSGGVLIDDLVFFSEADMMLDSVLAPHVIYPVLKGKSRNPLLNIQIFASGFNTQLSLQEITINTLDSNFSDIVESTEIISAGKNQNSTVGEPFGNKQKPAKRLLFKGDHNLHHGVNNFYLTVDLKENVSINSNLCAECFTVKISGKTYPVRKLTPPAKSHLGIALRQHNEDGVDTYRIPGLATTNKGTLIAVYDMRWNSATDLQEDVDVGMSRSTDGGETWEPMKVIMDMKEWGGLPEDQNGIGDPSVLIDRNTNTIWVAAVWAHGHPGQRNWWASKPGMKPEKTSQFVLVKSEDDGITWSEPINITKQIKKKEWYLLLQGPGKGITLKDGTLVFPAQFKDKEQMPHSTIIWSKDHGTTWNIGIGSKSNTTEAQVIELEDGGLMLNMRDNRNSTDKSETNGRSVYITYDLGKTWKKHPTSRTNVLKESTCQASLIKEEFIVGEKKQAVVLFSNPSTMSGRHHMTIKVSLDDGFTWPEKYHFLIDSGHGRGYSCLTRIDDKHFGILYEGSQADLIFQKFSIDEILKK